MLKEKEKERRSSIPHRKKSTVGWYTDKRSKRGSKKGR